MRIIGLDIHRAFAEAVAWKDGKLSRAGRVIMRREPLEEFAKQLSKSDIVVIEATQCGFGCRRERTSRQPGCNRQSEAGPPHCACEDQNR